MYARNDQKVYKQSSDGTEEEIGASVSDAGEVSYTPSDTGGSWNGVDPGNVDDALDNLASRNVPKGIGAINDDGVYSFTPPNTLGVLVVQSRVVNHMADIDSMISFRADGSAGINPLVLGANAVVTTGALSSGSSGGTDGKINISVHTDGKIYIKNRLGGTRYINYFVLSSVA